MHYISHIVGLDAYSGVRKADPPFTEERFLQDTLSSDSLPTTYASTHANAEYTPGKIAQTIGMFALAIGSVVTVAILGVNIADAKANPYQEPRMEQYSPSYPQMDPGMMDPSVIRINPYELNK